MILPPFLKAGDKIGVIAPAGNIAYPADLQNGLAVLRSWGLEVIVGNTPALTHFQFAGTDAQRLDDIQSMLDRPEIKAVIAVRGGYGCSRIIDEINFSKFKKTPKWVIGFSDLTLLLCHLERRGIASIHGPMVKQIGEQGSEHAIESLRKILFGETVEYSFPTHPLNRPGNARSTLIGGNVCLLAHSIGSLSEADTRNKLLFIEDVGETLYNLDRMMWQLKRAGKLKKLAGLIVGQLTAMRGTPDDFGQTAYEVIFEKVKPFGYPVAFGIPIGHIANNLPLLVGGHADLTIDRQDVSLSF